VVHSAAGCEAPHPPCTSDLPRPRPARPSRGGSAGCSAAA
jgi:hypothetical protein